jgi:hypothetical protein
MSGDPSLRSGFRLRAPASLTPAKRLNFAGGDLVGNGLGEYVNSAHGDSEQWLVASFADGVGKAKEGRGQRLNLRAITTKDTK